MFMPITLFAAVITLAAPAPIASPEDAAGDPPARAPRVRPYDTRSATLLLQGIERSDTLRAIVDRLEQLDVIVYLEMQPNMRPRLAGTLTWLTATTSKRYVRISLNPRLVHDALISTLGHELQHALEVAEAPFIVDAQSLEAYYRTHGLSMDAHTNGWDTVAARTIGEDVRRELSGRRVARVAESIQAFNPEAWHIVYRRARSMLPP